jgi:hypothetical protein
MMQQISRKEGVDLIVEMEYVYIKLIGRRCVMLSCRKEFVVACRQSQKGY